VIPKPSADVVSTGFSHNFADIAFYGAFQCISIMLT